MINIRRILVDTRCSNEFNGGDLIWFYGARMHDKICATNVLNIIVEKYMQILLMMFQNMAFFSLHRIWHHTFFSYFTRDLCMNCIGRHLWAFFYLLPTRNLAMRFWGHFRGTLWIFMYKFRINKKNWPEILWICINTWITCKVLTNNFESGN